MNKFLLDNLESHEPVFRFKTLLHLLAGDFIPLKEEQLLSVISLLEDSQNKIRFAALNVLVKYSRHLGKLESSVAFTIMKITLVAFHGIKNIQDFDKFTSNALLETRIQALYALKGFMKILDGNFQVTNYLNFILKTIIDSKASVMLKVAAVKVINQMSKTPRNIKRVFTLFKNSVQSLQGPEILVAEKERFDSNWEYFGFVKEHHVEVQQIDKRISLKGILVGHERREREIRLFGSLLTIEADCLLSVNDLPAQESNKDNQEVGVIKFGTEKAIVFSRYPFQETVYIRNYSDKEIKFCLQVFPPEFYTLSPAMGTLKAGESLGVSVVFSLDPFSPHILQMIHGYIRIRSMGCALDR
jgi:hypothetical protein